MFLSRAQTASVLLVLCAQAHARQYTEIYGNPISKYVSNATRPRFERAIQNPNATRSLNFRPFRYWPGYPPDQLIEWTWRVNVSDIAVPDAVRLDSDAYPLVDPHVANMVYDLSWPGGGNVPPKSLDPSINFTYCATTHLFMDFPASASNLYTEGHLQGGQYIDPTDCKRALGESCVEATLKNRKGVFDRNGRCSQSIVFDAPECAGTIGDPAKLVHPEYSVGSMSNNMSKIQSGQAFWGGTSVAYNGSDPSGYLAATNMLQIMRLDIKVNYTSPGGPELLSQLLCMRVNTTKLPTDKKWDTNGDGVLLTGEAAMGVNAAVSGYGASATGNLLILGALLWFMY